MRGRAWRSASNCPAADVHKPMPALLARTMFCNDMDADQRAFTRSVTVPEAPQLMAESISRANLAPASQVPRTYVKLQRDRALRRRMQDRFIAHLGDSAVRTMESGHDAMISRPAELAAALNDTTRNDSVLARGHGVFCASSRSCFDPVRAKARPDSRGSSGSARRRCPVDRPRQGAGLTA